jgi:hypothetical protein
LQENDVMYKQRLLTLRQFLAASTLAAAGCRQAATSSAPGAGPTLSDDERTPVPL